MNMLCRCGPRTRRLGDSRLRVVDARARGSSSTDPTGTLPLQRRFQRDLDARWRALCRMMPDVIKVRSSHAAAIGHAAITGQDPVRAFQAWMDEAMRQIVLGSNGAWTLKYVREAGDMGTLHAGRTLAARSVSDGDFDENKHPRDKDGKFSTTVEGPYKSDFYDKSHFIIRTKEGIRTVAEGQQPYEGMIHPSLSDARWYLKRNGFVRPQKTKDAAPTVTPATPPDRVPTLQSLCISELQGIMEAVSQQAVRAYSNGLLLGSTPYAIARSIQKVIDDVGVRRGHLLVSWISVRTHAAATLDSFRASGVSHVGTVAERARAPTNAPSSPSVRARDAKKSSVLEGLVEVLTAGDDNVCPECQDISDEGPYTLDEAERLIPAHPNCRCAFVPADDERYADVHDAPMLVGDFDESEHPRDDKGRWASAGAPQDKGGANKALYDLAMKSLGKQYLTTDEVKGLTKYAGDGYIGINNGLRKSGRTSEAVTQIDSAIAKSTMPKDIVVYRGVGGTLSTKVLDQVAKKSDVSFVDKAFVSTTLRQDRAKKFSRDVMEIRIPKGSKALPLPNGGEEELLLPRNSKFRVVSAKKTITGSKMVVELVS